MLFKIQLLATWQLMQVILSKQTAMVKKYMTKFTAMQKNMVKNYVNTSHAWLQWPIFSALVRDTGAILMTDYSKLREVGTPPIFFYYCQSVGSTKEDCCIVDGWWIKNSIPIQRKCTRDDLITATDNPLKYLSGFLSPLHFFQAHKCNSKKKKPIDMKDFWPKALDLDRISSLLLCNKEEGRPFKEVLSRCSK